ncbi:MAG: minor capsid protein [Alphaproteobacteria bacterium]|nr:minor capsid protein [Alphaproteobacteria bacterium]
MKKDLSLREELELKMRGRMPLERLNPQKGESRWYYIDPRGRDDDFVADTKVRTIDVDCPDTPNPYLQEIMLEEAKDNPQNYYIWRTEGDDLVREEHAQRDGEIFAWDEPPSGGHPGEDYNCRCTAEEFSLERYMDKHYRYKLGSLSEEFESNGNPSAIGYDKTGGYSYGKYQIETKKGTMKDYISFLENTPQYTNFANQLIKAGGENAAKLKTDEFENIWKSNSKNPNFNQSQTDFIVEKKLKPLLAKISDIKGLNLEKRHPVIKDVLYSVAVQHGKASTIVRNAWKGDVSKISDEDLITSLYQQRMLYVSKLDIANKNNILNRYPKECLKAINSLN